MSSAAARPRKVVVVGASLAGLNALQEARRRGFDGELVLVGAEPHLPYDRPPLSKALLDKADAETPHFPGVHTLQADLGVELHLGKPATSLDVTTKTVTLGAEVVSYDALIIATGAHARTLPGSERVSGVHTLRSLDDALAVRAKLDEGARVVIIGAGFIGSEVAAAARKRELDVTILEALPAPLERIVGAQAGIALTRLHGQHGTKIECSVRIDRIEHDAHSAVTGVRLTDGRVFPADLVVVGIGASPAVEWLAGSGLTLDDGVVCDERLSTGADGVWAAGDVARWPNGADGALRRVEHWTNAVDQGVHAMANALDPAAATPYRTVPYFWSDWYDSVIQFAGAVRGAPVIVAGSWNDTSFTALYFDGPAFTGVLSLNRRADVMKFRALLNRGATAAEAMALAESRRAKSTSQQHQ